VYDAREGSQQAPTWQACFTEVVQVIPGLMLAFMEAVVLTAISVAISTRLPMLANLVICFSVYAVGHLAPTLVEAAPDFEVVRFVGQLTGVVFPILKWFNVDAAIVGGTPVPFTYVATVGAYCLLYCTIAMLLALFLFEDRDLA